MLPDVDTGRLLGLKYELVCHFKLAADMVSKFVNHTDRPAFLERELKGFGVDCSRRSKFTTIQVD